MSAPSVELITIDAAVERIGYGKFQLRVMLAAGLCFAADAMEILLLSFLSVVLQAQWNLTTHQTALLTSIVFLGQFLGTLVLGPLGDRWGRKPVFLIAASIITVFGFATAAANNFASLVIVRMLVGFGVGGLIVPFDGMAELLPVAHRGRDLLFIEYFWTLGTLLVPLAAYLTLDNPANEEGWRAFVVLCALPCLFSTFIGYCLVPESPRWLLTQGRPEEALAVLRSGAQSNGLDPYTVFPEGTALKPEQPEAASIKDLFTPQWRWITMALWVTWAGFAFLYYGTILTTTLIFSDSAVELQDEGQFKFDYSAILISGSAEVFGTTFAIIFIDTIGRIQVQVVSYFLGGACILFLSIMSDSNIGTDLVPRGALVAVSFFARMFMMAGNITTWVATAEILTTEIRTTGHAYANALARVGGFCAPYLVQESNSPLLIGAIMFVISLLTTASASRLPETMGKQLGIHLNHSAHEQDNNNINHGSTLELQQQDGVVI